jgi:hypothetical protein
MQKLVALLLLSVTLIPGVAMSADIQVQQSGTEIWITDPNGQRKLYTGQKAEIRNGVVYVDDREVDRFEDSGGNSVTVQSSGSGNRSEVRQSGAGSSVTIRQR